jgi:hypothetical protein
MRRNLHNSSQAKSAIVALHGSRPCPEEIVIHGPGQRVHERTNLKHMPITTDGRLAASQCIGRIACSAGINLPVIDFQSPRPEARNQTQAELDRIADRIKAAHQERRGDNMRPCSPAPIAKPPQPATGDELTARRGGNGGKASAIATAPSPMANELR